MSDHAHPQAAGASPKKTPAQKAATVLGYALGGYLVLVILGTVFPMIGAAIASLFGGMGTSFSQIANGADGFTSGFKNLSSSITKAMVQLAFAGLFILLIGKLAKMLFDSINDGGGHDSGHGTHAAPKAAAPAPKPKAAAPAPAPAPAATPAPAPAAPH